jgi:diacylglycerol kinase family enzyme
LVANPTARSGKAKQSIDLAMNALRHANLEPEFFATLPNGETVSALAQRLEREDVARVIYLGGDGTFAEAAKGIILARERGGVDVPLGMLPMGTANDQGRSFGILAGEKALAANIQVIANGVEHWLDVGHVEGLDADGNTLRHDLWFDSFGLGLSAKILAQRNRDRERIDKVPFVRALYRDKLVYAGASVNSLLQSIVTGAEFRCELEIDGVKQEHSGVTDLVVKGTLLYGGDWIFREDARADDGRFEVVVIKGHADWLAMTIGSHKKNPFDGETREVLGFGNRPVYQARKIAIRIFRTDLESCVPAQIDGEEFPASDHYRITNLFQHLRIIVPENAHWV